MLWSLSISTQRRKTKVLLAYETEPGLPPVPFYFYLLFSLFLLIRPCRLAPIFLFFHYPGHAPASESRYLMCLLTRKLFLNLFCFCWKFTSVLPSPGSFWPEQWAFSLPWKLLGRRQLVPVSLALPWPQFKIIDYCLFPSLYSLLFFPFVYTLYIFFICLILAKRKSHGNSF